MERLEIAVLGSGTNETNVALVSAWTELGLDCSLVEPLEARSGTHTLVLGRLDVLPTLDGVEPGLLELLWLERSGAIVLNRAYALLRMHDKLRTAAALERAGLPCPVTRHLPPRRHAPPPQAPVVLKPRFGSWGRDVRLCRTQPEVAEVLLELRSRPWFRRHGVIAQAVLPGPGFDMRVLVADGRVVGAVERHPQPGEWRTNVSLGATRVPAAPNAAACRLAVAASAAVGADLCGVDLMPLPGGGFSIIEVNGAVEFNPEYRPSGDVYAAVAEALGLTVERELAPL